MFAGFSEYVPRKKSAAAGPNNKNPLTGIPGCYIVLHVLSGLFYIGSTKNIPARVSSTLVSLRINRHPNVILQEAFWTDAELRFFICSTENIRGAQELEQNTVNLHLSNQKMCNIAVLDVNRSSLGRSHTDESKDQMRRSNLGQTRSDESKRRMRDVHLGVSLSDETKRNMSKSALKRLATPEGKKAHARGIEKLMRPVMFNNVRYDSRANASRETGWSTTGIAKKIKRGDPGCFDLFNENEGK